jgi:hypothetical protein
VNKNPAKEPTTMPTATKNAAERTRLANFSLSLTPIIYLFIRGYKYKESKLCRAFLFLPLLPLHFIFFNFLLPKNDFDSLTVSDKN